MSWELPRFEERQQVHNPIVANQIKGRGVSDAVCAAPLVSASRAAKQLKTGGQMIIPVKGTYQTQKLMKVMKSGRKNIRTKSLMAVRFAPMTGAAQDK